MLDKIFAFEGTWGDMYFGLLAQQVFAIPWFGKCVTPADTPNSSVPLWIGCKRCYLSPGLSSRWNWFSKKIVFERVNEESPDSKRCWSQINPRFVYLQRIRPWRCWWRFRELIFFGGSPFNPCKLAGSISIKTNNASSFSQCIYNWRCVLCTVNWVLVQIQMWLNNKPTTTARC